jgi:molybdopterin molybdotransferase
MIAYEDALVKVRAAAELLPAEVVALEEACGRVSAESLTSGVFVPRFACSAMDGFAIIAGGPVRKTVRRKIVAGDAPLDEPVTIDEAVAIMTGAALPPAADAVVKIEDITREDGAIVVPITEPGAFVRPAGADYSPGTPVVSGGLRLTPEMLMAIGAVGIGELSVRRRPRVAIVPTGRELTLPGEPLTAPGAIWSSSAVYLQAALAQLGCAVTLCEIVRDEPAHLQRVLDRLDVDVVITTGAVSAGEHDFVPQVLRDRGAEIVFHKMATKPAKPTLFARQGRTALFGLAGNPISTAVGFRFLVWPYLCRALGLADETARRLPLAEQVKKAPGLKCFYKCRTDEARAHVLTGQDSHLVRPLTEANAWAATNETADTVDVFALQP